ATSDLTQSGLRRAAERAREWARSTRDRGLVDPASLVRPPRSGEYAGPVRRPWNAMPLGDKIELLRRLNERLKQHASIEDWEAGLWYGEPEMLLVRADGGPFAP